MTRRGRPTGFSPSNKGRANWFNKGPIRTSSALVRSLFELLDADGRSAGSVAEVSGNHPVTLSNWRRGARSPNMIEFENVAQALGYRLELVKNEEAKSGMEK